MLNTQPTDRVDLVFYLNRPIESLVRGVDQRSLVLGCTPAVNTFHQRAESIRLNELLTEYHVIPNAKRMMATEIYSIDRVVGRSASGETRTYVPFYASSHEPSGDQHGGYWYASRRPASPAPVRPTEAARSS